MRVWSRHIIGKITGTVFVIMNRALQPAVNTAAFYTLQPGTGLVNNLSSSVPELDDSFLVI